MSDTFLGFPALPGPAAAADMAADVAILGVPHGVAYPGRPTVGCAAAPAAIRRRSARLARFVDHHDFDLGGPLLDGRLRVVDCGDVEGSPQAGSANSSRAEAAVRGLLDAAITPVILGGDDSIPIPVLRAYADRGLALTVLQLDAHLDYRDEVAGVRDGYSSPMRRAAEMPHVERIVHVGLRGVGSARDSDVADSLAAGNLIVTARELRRRGADWLVEQLPPDAPLFIALDCDSLDPSVLGAVSAPSPGGLTYDEAADLIAAAVTRGRLAGMAVTEYLPELDHDGLSALVVMRLLMRTLGALARR